MRKVLVLSLILGTMLGASPALAKQQPGSSSSNHSFGHDRAIAIMLADWWPELRWGQFAPIAVLHPAEVLPSPPDATAAATESANAKSPVSAGLSFCPWSAVY